MTTATTQYLIRSAKAADVGAVTAMWKLMAEQHRSYDREVWCWSEDSADHWAVWYRSLLNRPEMVLAVAQEAGGKLVGFAISSCKDNPNIFTILQAGEIWDVFVHPDHRRRGIGKSLMLWTFDALKVFGAEDIKLHVALANPEAIALYEKLGMRPIMYRMYKRF